MCWSLPADLRGFNLTSASLVGAHFTGITLDSAIFRFADLTDANFQVGHACCFSTQEPPPAPTAPLAFLTQIAPLPTQSTHVAYGDPLQPLVKYNIK